MYIIEFLFIIFLFILGLWSVSNLIAILGGSPPVNTSRDTCREILKAAAVKKNATLIDLGSGSGSMVICAAADYDLRATGYELSPYPYLISKIKTMFLKNANIHYASLREAKLTNADFIYIYLLPSMLEKIEPKLAQDTRVGAVIITRGFALKSLKAYKEMKLGKEQTKVFFYKISKKKK